MSHHQQSDSFSTATNVPLSGLGTSTPETAAANANYSTWQWEVVLATVLGIPIPDRSEVTGQPWLTIVTSGQAAPGSHQIWTASWNDQPDSGATSIGIYLNPQLYTTGGPWDLFQNAPAAAMSAAAAAAYADLLVDPRTFQSARVALADVMGELATLAQQFSLLNHEATADATGFRGTMAGVAADLFSALGTVTLSLQDQMTTPASYSDVMGTTGHSAAAFLASLDAAYTGWQQVPEFSPLGAVVEALTEIATPDGNGGYAIPDPQNTKYGDLTTAAAWAAVEQQAKSLWTGALIGDGGDFAGLDPLGQSALGKLVAQYNTAISTLVPVIGPAPPPIKPSTLNYAATGNGPKIPGLAGPPTNVRTSSGGPGDPGGLGGTGGPGPGGQGPVSAFATRTGPGANGNFPPVTHAAVFLPGGPAAGGGGAGGTGASGAGGLGGGGAGAAAPMLFPVALAGSSAGAADRPSGAAVARASIGPTSLGGPARAAVALPGGQLPAGELQPGEATAGLLPGLAGANGALLGAGQPADGQVSRELSAGLTEEAGTPESLASLPRGLAGAIGAGAQAARAAAAIPEGLAFAGTIGQLDPARGGSRRRKARGREVGQVLGLDANDHVRQAPAAGFAIGRDLSGGALQRSAVPMIQDKPQAVLSSSINGQLAPGTGGNGAALAGGDLGSAGNLGRPANLSSAGNLAGGGMPGSPEMLGPGAAAAAASGESIGGNGQMMGADMGGMGMGGMGMGGMGMGGMGMGGMGMGGMGMGMGGRGGRGQAGQERERLAYLPEDEKYWGTAPPVSAAAVGADAHDDLQDQEFRADSSRLAGIGADDERGIARNSRPDRRMP